MSREATSTVSVPLSGLVSVNNKAKEVIGFLKNNVSVPLSGLVSVNRYNVKNPEVKY